MNLPESFDVLMKWQTSIGDSGKAPIKVDLSEGDWAPPTGFVVGKITCTGGTVIMADWSDGENAVESLPLPAVPMLSIINITRIRTSGTDALNIVVWPAIL